MSIYNNPQVTLIGVLLWYNKTVSPFVNKGDEMKRDMELKKLEKRIKYLERENILNGIVMSILGAIVTFLIFKS